MANLQWWSGYFVSGPSPQSYGAPPLRPGMIHSWMSWGFDYGDVLTVTAQPAGGLSFEDYPSMLQVEELRIEYGEDGGRRMYFNVRNVGTHTIEVYGIFYSSVSS